MDSNGEHSSGPWKLPGHAWALMVSEAILTEGSGIHPIHSLVLATVRNPSHPADWPLLFYPQDPIYYLSVHSKCSAN